MASMEEFNSHVCPYYTSEKAWFYSIFFYFIYPGLAGEGNRPTAEQIELRLIQSLDDIRNPNITFKAQQVSNWLVAK